MNRANTEREALEQVVNRLRSEGYDVHVDVRLPGGLVADAFAKRGSETLVVDVRLRGNVGRATRIAEFVEQQPGWSFELVVVDPQTLDAPDSEWITDRIQAAELLLQVPDLISASLLAWAAVEAGLRRLSLQKDADARRPSNSVGAMIAELYSNDLIGDRRYHMLRKSLETRNRVAHGFAGEVQDEEIHDLVSYARTLTAPDAPTTVEMSRWIESQMASSSLAEYLEDNPPGGAAQVMAGLLATAFPTAQRIDQEDALELAGFIPPPDPN